MDKDWSARVRRARQGMRDQLLIRQALGIDNVSAVIVRDTPFATYFLPTKDAQKRHKFDPAKPISLRARRLLSASNALHGERP